MSKRILDETLLNRKYRYKRDLAFTFSWQSTMKREKKLKNNLRLFLRPVLVKLSKFSE